jgi:hypothetical protein
MNKESKKNIKKKNSSLSLSLKDDSIMSEIENINEYWDDYDE